MKDKMNYKFYRAEKDQNELDVRQSDEINISKLSYDPQLAILESCKLCLIESRNRSMFNICSKSIEKGIKAFTEKKTNEKIDKTAMEPPPTKNNSNIICKSSENCVIQDLSYRYRIKKPYFSLETEKEILDYIKLLKLKNNNYMLYKEFLRNYQEFKNFEPIYFLDGIFETRVASVIDQKLGGDHSNYVSCDSFAEDCSNETLSYNSSISQDKEYKIDKIQTTCPYCGVGCQLELHVKKNEIIKVESRSNENSPNSNKGICVKGRFGYDFVNHSDRITQPLINRNGEFQEVSWDAALNYVVEELKSIKKESGPDSIAGLSSAKCTNEENYLMQKFMRAVIGTNNIDHCARLCHSSTVAGLKKSFGSAAMTNSIEEISSTDVIFVIGSNTTENHPIIGSKIKKAVKNGAKLIVADPRKIELSQKADIHLQQKPGTDTALLNGLLHVIVQDNLQDTKYIEERTENFEGILSSIKKYDIHKVEEITGVSAKDITKAAILYASMGKSSIYYGMGITQHKNGTDNVISLANLAMATGNVGKEGTGVNPLRGQNNVQGACDLGALPDVFPGYQSVIDSKIKGKFEEAWNTELPSKEGLTVVEIFKKASKNDLKSLYIIGENPVVSDPDQNHVKKALRELNFLVVQDIFLTETAEYADVVLPASSFAEKQGTYTNTERRIQKIRKAINPLGESKPDWKIICELSKRLGFPMRYDSPKEVMNEITELTPIYRGVSYNKIENSGVQWPCVNEEDTGTKFLHENEFFKGKGRFHISNYLDPVDELNEEFNYVLMTGRMLYHFQTGTMTRRSEPIDEYESDSYIEINEKDAKKLGIKEREKVKITSRRGQIQSKARISKKVEPGNLFMPFHFKESPVNRLTTKEFDPEAKIPELKVTTVKMVSLE